MRTIFRALRLLALGLCLACVSTSRAQTPAPAQVLGIIVKCSGASIGSASASEGASIYSGDYLSTNDNGSLLVRVATLSFQLEASSALHIYRSPYGAVIELDRGTVIYTTPGGKENLVIVAADVRVTPDPSLPDLGRVSIDNPCEVSVYSQRGQANAQSGKENHLIEQGKAYRVRAENRISYREYLSPDDTDYHRYHEHEPCAALDLAHGHTPIAPAQSHFLLVATAGIGAGVGVAVWKAMESPDKP
jgi:hypothetical protein